MGFSIRYTRRIVTVTALGSLLLLSVSPCVFAEDWFGDPIVSPSIPLLRYPSTADLNNDGYPDLVARTDPSVSQYRVFIGHPTGQMTPQDSVPSDGGGLRKYVLVDENRDGFIDIVAENRNGGLLRIWRNDGTARFTLASEINLYFSPPYGTGDLDGDGFQDLVGCDVTGVDVVYGTPSGLDWAHPRSIEMTEQYFYYLILNDVKILDLDGDSRNDLLVVGAIFGDYTPWFATIRWRLGLGGRQFAPTRAFLTGDEGDQFFHVAPADLDEDGDLDLGCDSYWTVSNTIYLYDKNTDMLTPGGNPFYPNADPILFADLNHDDLPDALLMGWSGNRRDAIVYSGEGNGGFSFVQDLLGAGDGALETLIGPSGLDYISVSVGDAEGPPIGVWPNLIFDPAGVTDPGVESRGVRAMPSVSSTPIRIDFTDLPQPLRFLEILDVRGAVIRALAAAGRPETEWDLRDSAGRDVPSGVYWIWLQDHGRKPTTLKVHVVR